ncbi:hypothetical protein M404DRAFT_994644 [Pisolithus tinctorius Marx 270]|uniref:Uncharacterized protein n=1 Tax=Pisolithus tinctorius Marx 270 TaxID=870435 RepID=A0A0C3JS16_PISTI|nr:hypothetical protein M404DRAFT_994644 [Pisolithus tinctorius Marx 270]
MVGILRAGVNGAAMRLLLVRRKAVREDVILDWSIGSSHPYVLVIVARCTYPSKQGS